jgi:flagellar biosynthesis protein FlhF
MIYRVYRAPTYKEAVLKAKMELGSDVYIIARKEVKEGGFLGMFATIMTEITVAKNEERDAAHAHPETERKMPASSHAKQEQAKSNNTGIAAEGAGIEAASTLPQTQLGETSVMSELMEIKRQLKTILHDRSEDDPEQSQVLQALLGQLKKNDFSEEYVEKLRSRFESELTLKDLQDPEAVREHLKSHILDNIRVSGPITVGKTSPRIVVLVGPTGVGKTTTIAKLAASFGVLQKKRVELLTIDSYRIAAIEQLGKYAELMQLPFSVINSREEYKNAVMNSKAEILFVDTVGRSQKNNLGLAELRDILDGVKSEMDVHLVLSATTKYRDAMDVIARFNQLVYKNIIITKLDETNTVGPLLSILGNGKCVSYFTTGQSVPDDIEIARKEKLYELVNFDAITVRSTV